MDLEYAKKIINVPLLLKLFERFLSVMGHVYVDHCIRTAYLVYQLCKQQDLDPELTRKVVFAAYFHDIGSIGKDLNYLSSPDYDILHSVDGYLLLLHKSPLKEWAKILLYHHVSYDHHIEDEPYYSLGLKIAVCDRLDDWERNQIPYDDVIAHIKMQRGVAFDPDDVDALLEVMKNPNVVSDIQSGRYKEVLNDYIGTLEFSPEDIQGYILMLATLFELYNDTTYNHSKTVAVVGAMLAKCMGYSENDQFKTYIAGLIHDLGKIFIPLSILDKPGKLTPEEYEVMKTHIVYSRKLSEGIFPLDVLNIATYHHERLDGSGYPNHLVHAEMTELDELMQVGDVVSALVARRPYKAEFPYEKVEEILRRDTENGKFNPKVVETFFANHEAILEAANRTINEGYEEVAHMKEFRDSLIQSILIDRAVLPDMPLSNFAQRL